MASDANQSSFETVETLAQAAPQVIAEFVSRWESLIRWFNSFQGLHEEYVIVPYEEDGHKMNAHLMLWRSNAGHWTLRGRLTGASSELTSKLLTPIRGAEIKTMIACIKALPALIEAVRKRLDERIELTESGISEFDAVINSLGIKLEANSEEEDN